MRTLLLGALAALALAGGAQEAAAGPILTQYQERSAEATFRHLDGDVRTTVSIYAGERRMTAPGGATQVTRPALATIVQRDVTDPLGDLLVDATATAELPEDALVFDGRLDRARLVHTFQGFDGVTGRPARIDVDVAFTAYGDVQRDIGPTIIRDPIIVNGHKNYAARWSDAIGDVSIAGRSYTHGPAYAGALRRLEAGDVAILP